MDFLYPGAMFADVVRGAVLTALQLSRILVSDSASVLAWLALLGSTGIAAAAY
jgi:hypothetical protein